MRLLAGRVGGKTDAVLAHIVDDVLVLDGDISENGSHTTTTGSDTPAVSNAEALGTRDEVVVGVDVEVAPARDLSGDDGEALDLDVSHREAVVVEDGLTRSSVANTRKIGGGAHGLDALDERVVGGVGEDQEGSSRINDRVGVVASRVAQSLSVDGEVVDGDDEPLLLGDGGPLGARGSSVTEGQRTTSVGEAHGVDRRDLVLLNHAQEGRDASPGRESGVAQTENSIDSSGPSLATMRTDEEKFC